MGRGGRARSLSRWHLGFLPTLPSGGVLPPCPARPRRQPHAGGPGLGGEPRGRVPPAAVCVRGGGVATRAAARLLHRAGSKSSGRQPGPPSPPPDTRSQRATEAAGPAARSVLSPAPQAPARPGRQARLPPRPTGGSGGGTTVPVSATAGLRARPAPSGGGGGERGGGGGRPRPRAMAGRPGPGAGRREAVAAAAAAGGGRPFPRECCEGLGGLEYGQVPAGPGGAGGERRARCGPGERPGLGRCRSAAGGGPGTVSSSHPPLPLVPFGPLPVPSRGAAGLVRTGGGRNPPVGVWGCSTPWGTLGTRARGAAAIVPGLLPPRHALDTWRGQHRHRTGVLWVLPPARPDAHASLTQMAMQLLPRHPCITAPGARSSLSLPDFGAAGKQVAFATRYLSPIREEGAKLDVVCLLRGCPGSLQRQLILMGSLFIPKSTS